jgi:hypothetical protein
MSSDSFDACIHVSRVETASPEPIPEFEQAPNKAGKFICLVSREGGAVSACAHSLGGLAGAVLRN